MFGMLGLAAQLIKSLRIDETFKENVRHDALNCRDVAPCPDAFQKEGFVTFAILVLQTICKLDVDKVAMHGLLDFGTRVLGILLCRDDLRP